VITGNVKKSNFFSPDPAKIFSGVTICTEGLLPGDSEVVKGIVSALGGQWRGPLVAEVTHLICMNLEGVSSFSSDMSYHLLKYMLLSEKVTEVARKRVATGNESRLTALVRFALHQV